MVNGHVVNNLTKYNNIIMVAQFQFDYIGFHNGPVQTWRVVALIGDISMLNLSGIIIFIRDLRQRHQLKKGKI